MLWFDGCLFDQLMLVHILACLSIQGVRDAELLCVDEFPGIVPFNGMGQLTPHQLASLYDRRRPVTEAQYQFAAADTPPQYWGDITLWARINALADRTPPLVRIDGPMPDCRNGRVWRI